MTVINDIDGIPINFPRRIVNNEMIFVAQPYDIIEEANNNDSPEFIKSFKKLGSIKEEDNPVLVFAKIRKF